MGFAVYVNGAEPEPPSTVRDIVIPVVTVEPVEQEEPELSQDPENEMELLARCIEAEAGNQSVLGRRLVADVILNRVDSPGYPDTIRDVIYQPGQFAVVKNGAIDEVVPSAETWEAISRELVNRIDNTARMESRGNRLAGIGSVREVDYAGEENSSALYFRNHRPEKGSKDGPGLV